MSLPSHPHEINIAINAARIAVELPDYRFNDAPVLFERIALAAAHLHTIESLPDFAWETNDIDWESACALAAQAVCSSMSTMGPLTGFDPASALPVDSIVSASSDALTA